MSPRHYVEMTEKEPDKVIDCSCRSCRRMTKLVPDSLIEQRVLTITHGSVTRQWFFCSTRCYHETITNLVMQELEER